MPPALFFVSLVLTVAAGRASDRIAAPDSKAQQDAEPQIRDTFKVEFGKHSATDRKALAAKLLAQGKQTSDDTGVKYVLLKESAEIAASCGDIESVQAAADELTADFDIDGPAMESEILSKAVANSPADTRGLAEAYASLLEHAFDEGNYTLAIRIGSKAMATGKKVQDRGLSARVESLDHAAHDLQAEAAKYATALSTLTTKPDSAEANFAAGRFLCFFKSDWEAGLPKLAAGNDAAFKSAAQSDIASPSDAKEQIALGNAWYDLAARERAKRGQAAIKSRAAKWYSAALPGLTSLQKVKIEKRIAEASATNDSATGSEGSPTASRLSERDRAALTQHRKELLNEANIQTDESAKIDTLIEAAKVTFQLGDGQEASKELQELCERANKINAGEQVGHVLIAEGECLGSMNRWDKAESALSKVWTTNRGAEGNNGCAAAEVMAKHCIDIGRADKAVNYKLIVIECRRVNNGASGEAGLWIADYYLARGDQEKAVGYLNLVKDQFKGPYDVCAKKAIAKLAALHAGAAAAK